MENKSIVRFFCLWAITIIMLIMVNSSLLSWPIHNQKLNLLALKSLKISSSNEEYKKQDKTKNQEEKQSDYVSDSNFSFAVLGDNKYSVYNFYKVLRDIKKDQDIDFVINTGDLGYPGTCLPLLFYKIRLENFNKPVISVPGNHEVFNGSLKCFKRLIGNTYSFFIYKNNLFIFLDDSSYIVDENQLLWLKNVLKKYSKEVNNTFIFMHVPFVLPDGIKESLNGKDPRIVEASTQQKLQAIFTSYKIKLIFFGHVHGYYNYSKQGKHFIITGGAGTPALLYNYKNEKYQNHWIKVTVNNDKIDTQFKPVSTMVCSGTFCKIVYDVLSLLLYWILIYGWFLLVAIFLCTLISKIKVWINQRKTQPNSE